MRVQIGLLYTLLALINIVFFSVMIFENQTDLLIVNFKFHSENLVKTIATDLEKLKISRQKDAAFNEFNSTLGLNNVKEYLIFDNNGAIWHKVPENSKAIPENKKKPGFVEPEIKRKTLELGTNTSLFRTSYYRELNEDDFSVILILPVMGFEGKDLYLYTEISIRAIKKRLNELYFQIGLSVVWGIIFHILFGIFVYRIIFQRVGKLKDASNLMATGDLKARAQWKYVRSDELDDLGSAFNMMAGKIEETVGTITRLNEEIQQELEIGKEVQELFLPQDALFEDRLSMYYRPLREVSGDIYNFYKLAGGYKGLFFADAAGHGVSAALITTITIMSLEDVLKKTIKPWEVLTQLNTFLADKLQSSFFATAVFFLFSDNNTITYFSNAGHNPPLCIRPSRLELIDLDKCGPPLGMMDEVDYTARRISTKTGDKLFIYSDGLVETRNTEGEEFGLDRVKQIITENATNSGKEILSILSSTFEEHAAEYKDDVTIIILEIP